MLKYILTIILFISTSSYAQFFEDFENGVPGSMTEQLIVGEENWVSCFWDTFIRTGGVPCPLNGDYTATFFSFSMENSTSIETPLLDLSSDLYRLKFTHAQKNWDSRNNDLFVEISNDAGVTWTLLKLYNYSIPVPIEESFDLQSYFPTDETIIRFRTIAHLGYSILLDDISVTPIPENDVKILSVNENTNPIVTETQIPITGKFINYGLNTINSVVLNWKSEPENITHSQEITSLSLEPGEVYNFLHNNELEASFGLNVVTVWLSNLNGIDNDEDSSNDLFVKKINVASNIVSKQRVLYEEFTSSTCSPCNTFNTYFFNDEFLDNNEENFSLVKYQMYWPAPGDDYYTEEGGMRRDYYGVSGVPTLKLDGDEGRFNDTQILQEKLDEALLVPSYFSIEASHSLTTSGLIDVDVTIMPFIGDHYRVHIVVVEKETTENVGTNGETYFRNVMMKMLPDAEGTLLEFIPNEPINLNFSEDLSNTFIEEINDLEVIVFIQDEEYNRKVMQSQLSTLEVLNIEEFDFSEFKIHPNPSDGTIKLETSQPINITIYNVLGKLVFSKRDVNNTMVLNVSELSSGVYLVKLNKDKLVEIKRLIIE